MKPRSQVIVSDGFDKNVAEKMPKIRKLEDSLPSYLEGEPQPLQEDHPETAPEVISSEQLMEKKVIFESPKKGREGEQNLDVLKLIEDLHAQLLASAQTKRALEMDLTSYQKTIHQLARDNQELRGQLENQSKEHLKFRESQSEFIYLKEENEDALERIQKLQQELKEMNETLVHTLQEKNETLIRIQGLESQLEQNELLQIKGRLREKEASHFYEENQRLQSRLEEALSQNLDLERKYETLKKSFNEVRESLILLRDSCKKNYYNLSEAPE